MHACRSVLCDLWSLSDINDTPRSVTTHWRAFFTQIFQRTSAANSVIADGRDSDGLDVKDCPTARGRQTRLLGTPSWWWSCPTGQVIFFPHCMSVSWPGRWFFSFQLQVCLSLSLSVSVSLCCNIANSFVVVVFSHKHRSAQFHYLPWDFFKIKLQTEYMLCDW